MNPEFEKNRLRVLLSNHPIMADDIEVGPRGRHYPASSGNNPKLYMLWKILHRIQLSLNYMPITKENIERWEKRITGVNEQFILWKLEQ